MPGQPGAPAGGEGNGRAGNRHLVAAAKPLTEFRDADANVVITLCDQAARDCPAWLGGGRQVHMGFPDPSAAEGSEVERLDVFRQVRVGIREKVLRYLTQAASSEAKESRLALRLGRRRAVSREFER